MIKNKQYLLLKITFFIRYFGDALFYSFLQVFLTYKSLSEGQIGLVASIIPITGLICNPFWNHLAKDVNVNRKILKIITILEGIFIFIFVPFNSIELLCVIVCLISIVGGPFYSLIDGFASTYANKNNKNYPSIRIMGSIAYIFGTSLGGIFIEHLSYQITIIFAGIIFIFTSLLISLIKPINLENKNHEIAKRDYKAIFKNKNFITYLIIYIFTVVISIQGDNYMSLYLTVKCELNPSAYGFVAAGYILVEVVEMLIFAKYFKNIDERKLIVLAGLVYTLRSVLLSFDLPLELSIAAVMLRGVAWGMALTVHVKYLLKIVGQENTTAAIFIISIIQSILTFVCSNVLGNLIEYQGYNIAYLSIAIICGSTTIYAFLHYFIFKDKTPKSQLSS